MPLSDPRIDILQAVYAVGGTNGLVDATYLTTPAELAQWPTAEHLGRVAYLYATKGSGRTLVERSKLIGTSPPGLSPTLGYIVPSPSEGMTPFVVQSSRGNQRQELGFAYPGPLTNGAIHSAEQTVSFGDHVIKLNRAAGGYIHSWVFDGTEILNRGDSWKRGLRSQLEWADGPTGHLVAHQANQSACRFGSGLAALGAPLLSIVERADPLGGHHIVSTAIPLDFDPDGNYGIPGVSTDHGGSDSRPGLWRDMRVSTDLWLDAYGIAGLHRLQTTWTMPFETLTGFFDCAAHSALCLDTAFDEVVVRDQETGTDTDVTALVDAVDYRRFSYAQDISYEDDVPVGASASLIPSGFGAIYGRNTGTDLTVAIAGRIHPQTELEPADMFLGDVPRGTNLTAVTNRTGGTGHDGDQVVILGLDSNLSTRWCDANQLRRIKGPLVTTRWVATGTLAEVLALLTRIPATY